MEEQGGTHLYAFVKNNPGNRWDYLGMVEMMPVFSVNGGRREQKQEIDDTDGCLYEITFQDMSPDPAYGFEDMQLVGRVKISCPRESDPCAGRSSAATRWWGALRAAGGLIEFGVGATLGIATSWTGIGAVAGGGVAFHGFDQFVTGARQAISGTQTTSVTSQALQSVGMTPAAANLTDTAISVAGSAGGGIATANIRLGQILATNPVAPGTTAGQVLRAWDTGSEALTYVDYMALGGQGTSALAKAEMMSSGVNALGQPFVITTTRGESLVNAVRLAGTGLTPLAAQRGGYAAAAAAGAASAGDCP